jgi:hypothetical protein
MVNMAPRLAASAANRNRDATAKSIGEGSLDGYGNLSTPNGGVPGRAETL